MMQNGSPMHDSQEEEKNFSARTNTSDINL